MQCISCGNTSFVVYAQQSSLGLPIYHCKNCGLYITGDSESKVKEKISTLYSGQYWNNRNSEDSIKTDYTNEDSQGKRRNWVSQYAYCKPYFKNKKTILEIGVGAGQATVWFENENFIVTGIEPDSRNVELINQKLQRGKCIIGNVEELNIDEKFDIIWMSHVLEHLIRPDSFLKLIKKNLKPDGIFFIEVPNCENKKLLDSTIKTQPHTFHFTKTSLVNTAHNAGYTVERCNYFRPATKIEGGTHKIFRNSRFMKEKLFPYYPRIITNGKEGRDLRIILKN